MKPTLFLAALLLPLFSPLVGQERSSAEVVRAALSPLPTDLRADAGVLVETEPGEFTELRPSGNGMSCVLRQPPDREEPFLDSRCYSDRFWPAVLHLWTMDPAPRSFAESYEEFPFSR